MFSTKGYERMLLDELNAVQRKWLAERWTPHDEVEDPNN